MFERFSRSWQMLKHSASILNQDRELLVFPLLSSLAAILVLASFVPLLLIDIPTGQAQEFNYVAFLLFYLVEYFVIFFFNSALVGAALIRMDGGDPTVMDGLRIASAKIGRIFGYALLAATVGLFLRAAGERLGFIGRLFVGLLGFAWTLASFLAVPVLVSRDIGPLDAVRESAALLKRTWGENIISNAGIGLIFMLVYMATSVLFVVVLYAGVATGNETLVIGVAVLSVLWLICLGLLQAALQGIFSAVLYRYAIDGQQTGGFSDHELSGAFLPKP